MEKMNMDDLGNVSGGVAESYDIFQGNHTKNSQSRHVKSAIKGVNGLPGDIKNRLCDWVVDHEHYLVSPPRYGLDCNMNWEYNSKTNQLKVNGNTI